MTNRLAHEISPYLLQHQNNPVDWYPWSNEALQLAKTLNKPVLLSVGYSACHWCHVMAHESFEDPEVAKIMNQNFINIKVDREERPDLDQIYQNIAQIFTQGGGWPLTVFLTPDLKPFYGGTYFPPDDRYGRPGFRRLLIALADAFKNQNEKVIQNADELTSMIRKQEKVSLQGQGKQLPSVQDLIQCTETLIQGVDFENGGFGGAPKFPNPMALTFLFRMGVLIPRQDAVDAVTLSLRKMASGGIYDQIGGGFHRYSVDDTWSVPHFEKMLYDNALLVKLYSEVLSAHRQKKVQLEETDEKLFLKTLRETVGYLKREMLSVSGYFYSAQDADSEGEEGKFFVFSPEEIRKLAPKNWEKICEVFRITELGNFEHRKSVLALDLKAWSGLPSDEFEAIRKKLYQEREKRIRPGLDDKGLVSWNGLMIQGLVDAAFTFHLYELPDECNNTLNLAFNCYEALLAKANDPSRSGRLKSVLKEQTSKLNGYLDDYSFLALSAIRLASVSHLTKKTKWNSKDLMSQAGTWCETILEHFSTKEMAGFHFTSDDHEKLITRPVSLYDQAIPSGSSVAIQSLLWLYEYDPVRFESFGRIAREHLKNLSEKLRDHPYGMAELACAFLLERVSPFIAKVDVQDEVHCVSPFLLSVPECENAGNVQLCHRQSCTEIQIAELQDRIEKIKLSD